MSKQNKKHYQTIESVFNFQFNLISFDINLIQVHDMEISILFCFETYKINQELTFIHE